MHRQGLKHLLIFAAIVNLVAGMVVVIVMPLALHMGTESQVGFILSAGGLGALLGSAYLTLTGGPQRKMNGVLIGTFFAGISLFVMGSQPIVWLVALAVLMFNACLTTAFGTEQVIWQHKVEASLQGRVFAAYDAVSTIAVPVGTFGVGLLADHWFEPLMMPDGGLADTFGPFIGIGPGRGLALMVIMLAVAMLLIAMWGWYNKAIFDIEKNLPDMIDDLHQQDAPSKLA